MVPVVSWLQVVSDPQIIRDGPGVSWLRVVSDQLR